MKREENMKFWKIVNNILVHEWLSQYVSELTWFDKFFLIN